MYNADHRSCGLEALLASFESPTDAGIQIAVHPELGQLNIRGDVVDEKFSRQLYEVLDQELPVTANRMTQGAHHVYWLGPDEWLLVTDARNIERLAQQLEAALAGQHAAVTNVSGGNIVLRMTGSGVREVLAKGCTLDFHPEKFRVADCAQTGLAKANVLISLLAAPGSFELVARRSFSAYLMQWLKVSSEEFGVNFSVI